MVFKKSYRLWPCELQKLNLWQQQHVHVSSMVKKVGWNTLESTNWSNNDYCDNISAIKISKNLVLHVRSKHIDVRHHFLCDLCSDGTIDLVFYKSEVQVADILTKPLKQSGFVKLRKNAWGVLYQWDSSLKTWNILPLIWFLWISYRNHIKGEC